MREDQERHTRQEEMEVQAKLVASYARRYQGADAAFYQNFWSDKLLGALDQKSSLRILDCGCAQGILMERAQRYGSVFGADLSFEFLVRNPYRGRVVQADMAHLPFQRNVFDAVFVRGALHHLESAEAALAEIAETLKTGGLFVCSEPNNDSLLLRIPRFLWYRFSSKFSHAHRTFSKREILELLQRRGYEVRKTSWFGFFAFPLCGLKDFLPVMDYLPFKLFLTKQLIALDELLSKIPLLNRQSWHLVVEAVKKKP